MTFQSPHSPDGVDLPFLLDVKPLALKPQKLAYREKNLPPTPPTEEERYLQKEIEDLRHENAILRRQINVWAHQVRQYRQITAATKSFSKEALVGIKHIQDAIFVMKRTERAVQKERMAHQFDEGDNDFVEANKF